MRLSKTALAVLRGMGSDIKDKLSTALNVGPQAVYKMIQNNHDNLTKAAALKVIREETGLTDEQILESAEEISTK